MKKIVNVREVLFLFCVFLIQFAVFTKNISFITEYSQYFINVAIIILTLLALITMFYGKFKIKLLLFIIIVCCISIISLLKTEDGILIQFALIFISSFGLELDKLLKQDIKFKIMLFLFIILCWCLGYAITPYFVRNNEIRYSMGFNQPNVLGFFVFSLFLEYVYISRNNIKFIKVLILFAICFVFMSLAKSRTAQICMMLFMILFFIMKQKIINLSTNKFVKIVLPFLFLFFSVISFYLTVQFRNGSAFAVFLNNILSGRLGYQNVYLNLYSVNLLGNIIEYVFTLDNVYIKLLLNFGVIIWGMFYYIYNKMIKTSINNNNNIMLLILIILFVYGLMEWYIMRPALNMFLLYFSTVTLKEKVKIGDKNE